jgi:hypothetical protein
MFHMKFLKEGTLVGLNVGSHVKESQAMDLVKSWHGRCAHKLHKEFYFGSISAGRKRDIYVI